MWSYADRNAWFYASGGSEATPTGVVGIRGAKGVTVVAGEEGIQMRSFAFVDINQALTVRPEAVVVRNLKAKLVAAENGLYGPEVGPTDIKGKVGSHKNHVRKYGDAPDAITGAELADDGEVDELEYHKKRNFRAIKLFKKEPSWNYLPKNEYVPDPAPEELPWKSISEERIAEDTELSDFYETWNWGSDNKLNTVHGRTGDKYADPWYGESPEWQYFEHTEPLLSELSSTTPDSLNEEPQETKEARTMHFRKRNP